MTISLRRMDVADIALGMELKDQARWNQVPEDWRRFLELEPEGCFVAQWEGRPVATTTTCVFGSVGWIAMVLVHESYRHRGIATRLVQHALDHLESRSVTTARLDATSFGRPVYERMGFVADHDLVRLEGAAQLPVRDPEANVAPVSGEYVDALVELDCRSAGADRRRLLERLLAEQPDAARLVLRGGTVLGYAMLRPGSRATQIGPVVATSEPAGRALCDWALSRCAGQPVFIDVPFQNPSAIQWAESRGLVEQRQFTRMSRGDAIAEQPALLWASSGPEKG